jgi:hypothetical protein
LVIGGSVVSDGVVAVVLFVCRLILEDEQRHHHGDEHHEHANAVPANTTTTTTQTTLVSWRNRAANFWMEAYSLLLSYNTAFVEIFRISGKTASKREMTVGWVDVPTHLGLADF